jgi:hypothetical protein
MIYVDPNTQPNEFARMLWRELGPTACIVERDGKEAA